MLRRLLIQPLDSRQMMAADLRVPELSSLPGSANTIHLDFDGHIVDGTYWNTRNQGLPIHAPAFDLDNDNATFSDAELERIDEIYQRVAEDFAPFDVNVTTVEPPAEVFSAGGKAIRAMISTRRDDAAMGGTGDRWAGGWAGVALTHSWHLSSDTPVWTFEDVLKGSEKGIAETVSHEVGHALGLQHHGTESSEYYVGHGGHETGWAPIMGNSRRRALTQWSSGEFPNADPHSNQDDIAILTDRLGLRPDDHGDADVAATDIAMSGDDDFSIGGIITTRDDVDVFAVPIAAQGELKVSVTPLGHEDGKSNLDAEITIRDADGNVLLIDNPGREITADFSVRLPAGQYYLSVDGVGRGDPAAGGYSDYGSLGQYQLSGSFTPALPRSIDLLESAFTSHGGSQDVSKSSVVSANGRGVKLTGNTWRAIGFEHEVTPSTVLVFDARFDEIGEIHGIGFANRSQIQHNRTFRLAGTQDWGIDAGGYGTPLGDGWIRFSIPVGEHYTGSFDRLFFVNDHDVVDADATSRFRDIRVLTHPS